MAYLLDTCALSELSAKKPDPRVVDALLALPREQVYISTITLGEIQQGIEQLPASARKDFLLKWFAESVLAVFAPRIIHVDIPIALKWGSLRAHLRVKGFAPQVVDSLIASTALVHDLTVVTENEKDFAATGVKTFNPWR
ncbi:MAG TPA: type II toxin-antitoxin system VapC family toxin [Phycisphaerae bacterium]|nr:type II toxin-antitoxin system VapC family toxin [Phycisphaerae bacterium]